MPRNAEKTSLRWKAKHVFSSNAHVPACPGLYAIGHDAHYLGLETERVYVYIGKTDNLRRRLGEHSPANEPKRSLRKYLQDNVNKAKYWYAAAEKESLDKLEGSLISHFAPKFNDTLKGEKQNGQQ